ncbi:MAG: CocE/NonD family hydrolase [Armatimonadetes bacterium]|nr:CocE/NonD family hydrolase [Armatimonadota bacterium]MDW8153185.1 CocE/NonD family hydrolase [Armatimonadota bacterium]
MSDGVHLSCDIFRPDADGRFPVILGCHPYEPTGQAAPIRPGPLSTTRWRHPGQERTNASLEAGDPYFFARRGYVHAICNVRGTGRSEGLWQFMGRREAQDVCELIRWIRQQPWCSGRVGMFGVSYFARIQLFVAAEHPEGLTCLFCPWASTDFYRDVMYRGGILAYDWLVGWSRTSLSYARCRPANHTKAILGERAYREAIAGLLEDEDLWSIPELRSALQNPEEGMHPFIVDVLLHPLYDEFWKERSARLRDIEIPAYLGGDWGIFGLHLPGAFRSWRQMRGPKKMLIGPPVYLDRPLYQLHFEALRWFDYWLKGMETRILEEPPVRLFVVGLEEWRETTDWPVPGTRWVPFFLHEGGLLLDREPFGEEGSDAFEDSPWYRGALEYATPPMVETTEILGPMVLKLYASSTDTELFWVASVYREDREGSRKLLTRGWLRGSQRHVDWDASTPWEVHHPHDRREPLRPGEIYEFFLNIVPTGVLLRPGERLRLKLSSAEDPPTTPLEGIGSGSLRRQAPSRITVYRNARFPSFLLVPITRGNLLGSFVSGGRWPQSVG